ncbi:MAG: VanZ family protein [Chloroflexota bacterium]
MRNLLFDARLHWLAAVGYSLFILAYLLQQPGSPPVEIVAPVAAPDWQREVAFTIGHIVGFGTLFVLWYLALRHIMPTRAAIMAFTIAMCIGLLAESLQNLLPDRTASLYDVAMNTLGMLGAWLTIHHWPSQGLAASE